MEPVNEVSEVEAESTELAEEVPVTAEAVEEPELDEGSQPTMEEPTVEELPPSDETTEIPSVEEVADAPVQATSVQEETSTEGEEAAEAPISVGVPGMDWYIIHTYSGFENKVKESLLSRAQAFGLGERIGEILIPTEDVVEMKAGKKVTSKRLLYPGYVLVQLKMDDELWHVVRNTPRVTSFVGSGQTPTSLSADEVNQILYRQTVSKEKPRPKMTFDRNDRVKIIDGPFSNFTGTVEEVNEDRSTLKVMVTIFGRGTPVELEYFQVEKEKV